MLMPAITCRSARRSLYALLAAITLGTLGTSPASAALPGSVYTQTNDPAGNEVVVFDRSVANGSLSEVARVATGGKGAHKTPPFGFDILDSQGGVDLSDSQRLLFAVNAGSDTVSSLRVGSGGGLKLVRSVRAGDRPVSVDSHGDLVYVLDSGSATIRGYRAAPGGRLTPIAGSVEPLSLPPRAKSAPAQILFDPTGRTLTVTHRLADPSPGMEPAGADRIDTFVLRADDTPGPAIVNVATGAGDTSDNAPFGFDYTSNGYLVVSNGIDGSISSYRLDTTTGALKLIDNEPTREEAPCWVVITPDNKYAFVTNTVTRLRIGADGSLTELLPATRVPGHRSTAPEDSAGPTDAALTPDGKLLTVLVSVLGPDGADKSQTNTYSVDKKGGLTLLRRGKTPADLPSGVSGLVASAGRHAPAGLAARVRPSRDRRSPFVYETTGRLILPARVRRAEGCAGKVTIRFKHGAKTIFTRRRNLTRSCTFSARTRFNDGHRLPRRGRLRVLVRFRGNAVLRPIRRGAILVRFG